jgi:hypothetical protein
VHHFFDEVQLDHRITNSLSEQRRLFEQHSKQKILFPSPYQWYTHLHLYTSDEGVKMRMLRNVIQNERRYLLSASFTVAQAIARQ